MHFWFVKVWEEGGLHSTLGGDNKAISKEGSFLIIFG